jgi:hypothetical protein
MAQLVKREEEVKQKEDLFTRDWEAFEAELEKLKREKHLVIN